MQEGIAKTTGYAAVRGGVLGRLDAVKVESTSPAGMVLWQGAEPVGAEPAADAQATPGAPAVSVGTPFVEGAAPPAAEEATDPAAVAERERRERESFGEFTRLLVQTLNRTSYYDPSHPAHQGIDEALFTLLAEFLAREAQISYLLQRGTPTELLVDGISTGRAKLSEILPASTYELFAPRFIDYFERYGLVMLAFRQGIDRDEFERFINVMSRPIQSKEQAFDLLETLGDHRVLNVSTLCWKELEGAQASLPWQVRVALARLRRDLRTVHLFEHSTPEELEQHRLRLVADVVGPLTQLQHLKLAVLHARFVEPQPEPDAAGDATPQRPVAATIVASLRKQRLLELAKSIVEELAVEPAQQSGPIEDILEALRFCVERFRDESIKEAEPVLCALYERAVLEFRDLPTELQEWLIAEEGEKRMLAGTLAQLPTSSVREVRVLGKLARLMLVDGHVDHAATVLSYLVELKEHESERGYEAAAGIGDVLSDAELAELVERIEAMEWAEAQRHALLLRCLGRRAMDALVGRILKAGAQARFGNAYHLLDDMPDLIAPSVAEALRRPGVAGAALRVLLALGQRHPHGVIAKAALLHVGHADPMFRLAALAATAAGKGPEMTGALRKALDDANGDVVVFAMTQLAERPGAGEAVRQHALKVLGAWSRETPSEVLVAAARFLGQTSTTEAERAAAVTALKALLDKEHGGLLRRAPPHPEVIEPARAALAQLGAPLPADAGGDGKKGWRDLFKR